MDRREFLRLTGLVALPAAIPLLASCSGDEERADPAPTQSTTGAPSVVPGSLQAIVNANSGVLSVNNAQAETLAGSPRVALGLVKDNKPITDAMVMVYIGKQADQPPVASARASWVQGEMAPRALYVADIAFPDAGQWLVGATARLKDGTVYGGGASIPVIATSPAPIPGQPAISVSTPTVSDPMGADPLCSDVPQCPMHAVSLDAALKNGKPTVLTFSAPAYCQTETCGPVVRLVKGGVATYGDRYNFIHVEVYDKDAPTTLVQPAQAWKLPSEPFTFFIDGKGIVRDRLSGAFGEDELTKRLAALSA